MEHLQVSGLGNSGPAFPTWKSLSKKCLCRRSKRSFSSFTRLRSLEVYLRFPASDSKAVMAGVFYVHIIIYVYIYICVCVCAVRIKYLPNAWNQRGDYSQPFKVVSSVVLSKYVGKPWCSMLGSGGTKAWPSSRRSHTGESYTFNSISSYSAFRPGYFLSLSPCVSGCGPLTICEFIRSWNPCTTGIKQDFLGLHLWNG